MAIVQHMHLHVLHKHAFAHIEVHTQSQRTVHGQNKSSPSSPATRHDQGDDDDDA